MQGCLRGLARVVHARPPASHRHPLGLVCCQVRRAPVQGSRLRRQARLLRRQLARPRSQARLLRRLLGQHALSSLDGARARLDLGRPPAQGLACINDRVLGRARGRVPRLGLRQLPASFRQPL